LRNSISLYEALTAVTSLLTEASKAKLGKARLCQAAPTTAGPSERRGGGEREPISPFEKRLELTTNPWGLQKFKSLYYYKCWIFLIPTAMYSLSDLIRGCLLFCR
jgi:hypothetical protein